MLKKTFGRQLNCGRSVEVEEDKQTIFFFCLINTRDCQLHSNSVQKLNVAELSFVSLAPVGLARLNSVAIRIH
jgi:hypothetical protein